MGSKNKNIDVSIITITYKSWDTLYELLAAIQQIDFKELTVEIVVVDNFPKDSKHNDFASKFPEVNFLKNPKNSGFASGCNFGAQHANGNHFLFLNPDTILTANAFHKMYSYLQQYTNCGIVSCKQKRVDGTYEKIKRYFPRFTTIFGFFRVINKVWLSKKIKETDIVLYPEWVSGAVVFISRVWFLKIGGWNEDYWMYYEDIELSKNIRDSGGEVALLKDVHIVHKHGASSRVNISTTAITKTEVLKSKHVYLSKHFTGVYIVFLQSLLLFYNLISKFIFAVLGIVFIFLPKGRLQLVLFLKLIHYYIDSILNRTWLSKRSQNHPSK